MNRSDTRIFQQAVFGMILACLALAASGAAQDTSSTRKPVSRRRVESKRIEVVVSSEEEAQHLIADDIVEVH